MAIYAYKESADNVYNNAMMLIDAEVTLRTSQNTKQWPPEIWFSDIQKT